jgi:SAM-dependent methyltransferase
VTADDVRDATTRAYDEIVDDFARRNADVSVDFAEFRASFVADVRDGGRVADLGCGPGRDAAHFLAVGLDVVAVDASRHMTLRARGVGVPAVQADMRTAPLRCESLDGIWSAASLLHVPRVDVPRTLRSWWSYLRSAGILGLATSLGEGEGWEPCPYDPSPPTGTTLRRWFVHHNDKTLLDVLDTAGFDIISAREQVTHRRWFQVLARRRDR